MWFGPGATRSLLWPRSACYGARPMQCGQCGESVPEGAHFCGRCGTRLPAPAPPSFVGRTIAGRYRLSRRVGEGGLGNVYQAEQVLGATPRAVAVKLLRPEWSNDPAVKARFHREVATVARLEHPNTVRVYDFGETEDGLLFIVMEYLEGRSLEAVLAETGTLPAARVARIVRQVTASLEEAHALGIVHRDLKPANIFLIDGHGAADAIIKLLDFGVAKGQPTVTSSGVTSLTELGAFVGTPAYMSPEQFSSRGVGPRSDIYSLAVTTYQMLAGRLPFPAETAVEWARAHMSAPPPPLAVEHGAGPIPESMRRAVLRGLSKDPAERQGSAAELANELERDVELIPARHAEAARAPAGSQAEAVAEAAPAAPAAVAPAGNPKTAPMLRLPEFDAPADGSSAVRPTLPMAEQRRAEAPPYPAHAAEAPRPQLARRLAWATLALVACGALALSFIGLNGRFALWRSGASAPEEPSVELPSPKIATSTEATPAASPEPVPSEPASLPPEPPEPPRSTATSPPASPPRAKPPIPPSPAPPAPSPTPPAPSAPPPAALPAPPLPTPALPVPPLPWSLPTAGACERCLQALQGSGHYAVVTAVAEHLLCEDRVGRERCEREIDEVAPAVAERAAREGNCPAALATVAAAVNVRVAADRFRAVDALCLR